MANEITELPAGYAALLNELTDRIHTSMMRATLAASREMTGLYWDVGRIIATRQETQGRGRRVVRQLSADLRRAFPDSRGYSPRNLWRMRVLPRLG